MRPKDRKTNRKGQNKAQNNAATAHGLKTTAKDPQIIRLMEVPKLLLGDFAGATQDYESSYQLNPKNANTLYGRGVTAIKLGRFKKGKANIEAALKLDSRIAEQYANDGIANPLDD